MNRFEDYLTITEAASRRGISRQAMFLLVQRRKIPATKRGNQWFIHIRDLEAYRRQPGGRPRKGAKKRPMAEVIHLRM